MWHCFSISDKSLCKLCKIQFKNILQVSKSCYKQVSLSCHITQRDINPYDTKQKAVKQILPYEGGQFIELLGAPRYQFNLLLAAAI